MKTEIQKNIPLPQFEKPNSLKKAQSNIAFLGCNMAEHAYLIGQNLIWVKQQLQHGEFISWIEENVWFKRSTAAKFIRHAEHCTLANSLEKYPIEANVQNLSISNEPAEIKQDQFRTIIIDPPWPYPTPYEKDTRRVGSQYPEMTIEAITLTEFPFADDCILWLWTTHKFLPISFEIIQEWGFDYKATMVWNKEKMGIGYWLRMQCEFCLLATMGNPIWKATDVRDFITEAGREHSRKPEQFYTMILDICPKPIGEAFGRQERKGIKIICGDEIGKFQS